MVESTAQRYEMPVMNESGYAVILPNVGESLDLVQNPHPDPYAQSSTPLFPLGTKLVRGEQVWRYCYNGDSTLVIAAPLESPAKSDANNEDDIAVTVNAPIGATTVYLTGTSSLDASPGDEDNEYAEGYLFVNDQEGAGQCRKIKSNEGFDSSGATEFKLYEALTIALVAGSSQCGVTRSPYHMVIVSPGTAPTGTPVGVTPIPVDINYYFWSQTGGPCAVVTKSVIALGTSCIIGTTAGRIDDGSAAAGELVIGYPLTPGATDTEAMMVFLTLDS